ncbi:hypothetical protein UCDDS831_g01804 [Diplodia seriata]|uniref:Uncharacterized protein n=1 Tax=Diplodia seriata TaxID=420778 RepID=A0A0G2HBM1_9PEZI|nr:hypothetical protein UCDDS831_g01804 [Diplodia seriata]
MTLLHKFLQLVKTIVAPEMVCIESLQEWVQARKMVRRSASATQGNLKLVHAFYVGMLGLRYRVSETHSRVLWPSQYTWLLNNGLVRWADHAGWGLSEELIRDKSKADGLVKLAAVLQVTWFVAMCATRAAHALPIAALEAMTLAYVFVMLVTYLFWWVKPKDITTAATVELPPMSRAQRDVFESLAMENTYDDDATAPAPSKNIAWYLVARDCKDDDVLMMHPSDGSDVSKVCVRAEVASIKPGIKRARPLIEWYDDPMIITQWDRDLYFTRWWPLICILGASFGAIHLVSWNSTFPTPFERWLWRSSALISVVTSIVCMQFETMTLRWNGIFTLIRVSSPVLYIISRIVMTAEVFAALRAMPRSTYDTYEIWNYWFHFL